MSHTPSQITPSRIERPSATSSPGDRFRHLSPVSQPESVHEISEALYEPFRDSRVRLHLAGCHIDQVPLLRAESGDYFLLNGTRVSRQYALSLGLDDLQQREHPPHEWIASANRKRLVSEIADLARQVRLADAADGRQWLVWCSHVHGTLLAEGSGDPVSIPFSLWGARLKKGLDQCPPYHCPLVDVATWCLAEDDDGTITDADSIRACEETNRRKVMSRLVRCSASGRRVDPQVLARCPVTDQPVLKRLLETCRDCFQKVAPQALARGRCESCRGLQKIAGHHAARISGLGPLTEQHPWLQQPRKILVNAQPRHWLVRARVDGSNWLVLFDRTTLEIVAVANSTGWLRPWKPVARDHWPLFLQAGKAD